MIMINNNYITIILLTISLILFSVGYFTQPIITGNTNITIEPKYNTEFIKELGKLVDVTKNNSIITQTYYGRYLTVNFPQGKNTNTLESNYGFGCVHTLICFFIGIFISTLISISIILILINTKFMALLLIYISLLFMILVLCIWHFIIIDYIKINDVSNQVIKSSTTTVISSGYILTITSSIILGLTFIFIYFVL